VSRLPARQAQAIALVYGAGCTVAEAAEVLGCGPETTKTHLKRGPAALAAALGTEDGREPDEERGAT
jgi:DNA-directed RNA polymerase specialized sigma24 family protein